MEVAGGKCCIEQDVITSAFLRVPVELSHIAATKPSVLDACYVETWRVACRDEAVKLLVCWMGGRSRFLSCCIPANGHVRHFDCGAGGMDNLGRVDCCPRHRRMDMPHFFVFMI